MSLPIRAAAAHSSIGAAPSVLDDIALSRIACAGGATRAQLVRDLGPLVTGKMSPSEWRSAAEAAIARLCAAGHVQEGRGRLRTTDTGTPRRAFLGTNDRRRGRERDVWLVAKALGVDAAKPGLRKALTRPDGLSALIVQQAFGLAMRQALSPSKLRAALALVALERAFGGNVKEGLAKGSQPLSSQAGRVLAGQLLHKPRDYLSDPRLSPRSAPRAGGRRAPTPRSCGSPYCAGSQAPRRPHRPAPVKPRVQPSLRARRPASNRAKRRSALALRNFLPVCS
jgi:hypothetical protein